ncbi:MAG TPA: hypothetical protein VJX23_00240 [Candidatus Binataceae bacterium]|nr:hypothetical protein [Candidatus Binataceae bacterium]
MRIKIVALITFAIAGLGISGCPALAIPGLAYSGYEYEKTGKLPGMPSSSKQSSNQTNKPSSQATPASESIE